MSSKTKKSNKWEPARKKVEGSKALYVVDYATKDQPKSRQKALIGLGFDTSSQEFRIMALRDKYKNKEISRDEFIVGKGEKDYAKACFRFRRWQAEQEGKVIRVEKPAYEVIQPDYQPIIKPTTGEEIGWEQVGEYSTPLDINNDVITQLLTTPELCQLWKDKFLENPKEIAKLTGFDVLAQPHILEQLKLYPS